MVRKALAIERTSTKKRAWQSTITIWRSIRRECGVPKEAETLFGASLELYREVGNMQAVPSNTAALGGFLRGLRLRDVVLHCFPVFIPPAAGA
jgi:hypothetical protein